MVFLSDSPQKTGLIAQDFAQSLAPGDFVALFGGMGAGKTHFVKGIGRALCPDEEVTSPTYALVHEHRGAVPLYHFDMYRILGEDDLYSTGFYDMLDDGAVVVTEWSENIAFALPPRHWRVTIAQGEGENDRVITIERVGADPPGGGL